MHVVRGCSPEVTGMRDSIGSNAMAKRIDFQTEPERYRHRKLKFDGEVADS